MKSRKLHSPFLRCILGACGPHAPEMRERFPLPPFSAHDGSPVALLARTLGGPSTGLHLKAASLDAAHQIAVTELFPITTIASALISLTLCYPQPVRTMMRKYSHSRMRKNRLALAHKLLGQYVSGKAGFCNQNIHLRFEVSFDAPFQPRPRVECYFRARIAFFRASACPARNAGSSSASGESRCQPLEPVRFPASA